jgi:hypothetical protein
VTRPARTALLLFAVALAVRLAVGMWTGLTRPPVEDERGYVALAHAVTEGCLAIVEPRAVSEGGEMVTYWWPRQSFRGPIAPVLFAPATCVEGMRLISILLGALGPPLLFLAARRGPLGDGAWWAGLAYALWPPAIYVSVRALSEAPSQALLLGALWGLCQAPPPREAPTNAPMRGLCQAPTPPRGVVFAGALAALAVLARPAALIPAALLVFATGSRRRAMGFLLAFIATMAPWMIRNWNLHGRPLLTTNTGVTLVGGNSQAAADAPHPGKWVAPEKAYAAAVDPPDLGMWGWAALSEEASDRRFTGDALRWVGEHPGAAVKLCFWKIFRLFDPDPHSEKDDAAAKAIVGWLTTAPMLLLALLGLTAWRSEWPWTLLVMGTVATAFLFYGDTRMRTPADPALLVFAAHGLSRLVRRRVTPT